MSRADFVLLGAAVYVALFLILGFSAWWRKKLLDWIAVEGRSLRQEGSEIEKMRKFLMEQNEWETRRTFYGNPLMNAAFDGRVTAYNARRERYMKVVRKAGQLFPW